VALKTNAFSIRLSAPLAAAATIFHPFAIFFAKGICIGRRFVYKPANQPDGLHPDGGFGE